MPYFKKTSPEVETVVSGKHAGEQGKSGLIWAFVLGIFIALLGFAVVKMAAGSQDFKPNADGSFPLFQGIWPIVPVIVVLAASVFGALIAFSCVSKKHVGIKIGASFLVVFFGAIILSGNLNAASREIWQDSLKSWVSETYGVEYDYLTEYHYAGVVGQPASKYEPAIYIDPPKNVKYLTTKEGKYVGELMPDVYRGESVRLYEISNEPKPPLMEPKK